jgi:hypothetical protein
VALFLCGQLLAPTAEKVVDTRRPCRPGGQPARSASGRPPARAYLATALPAVAVGPPYPDGWLQYHALAS